MISDVKKEWLFNKKILDLISDVKKNEFLIRKFQIYFF